MAACIEGTDPVPRWYVAVRDGVIVGGVGVIDNDFHERKDLAPNLCALYVEEVCRGRGLAGRLLDRACRDLHAGGIDTAYLVTDHTTFYERYGWRFVTTVREADAQGRVDESPSAPQLRLYAKRV